MVEKSWEITTDILDTCIAYIDIYKLHEWIYKHKSEFCNFFSLPSTRIYGQF